MKLFLVNLTLSTTLLTSSVVMTNNFTTQKNDNPNQLYVLGDSLSDNGNLANIFTHDSWNIDKVSFQTPFYHSSFSDGDVAASILAQKLKTTLNPAWYQKDGNNYAVAGAQAGQNSSLKYKLFLNHYALDHQADQLLKDHKIQKNDNIFIEIGGNDLFAAMDQKTSLEQDLTISNAITTEVNTIQKLISGGAHNLIIANAPDISKIPLYSSQAKSIIDLAGHLSKEFNTNWNLNINNLIKTNPKTNIKAFDLGTEFNGLIKKAQKMNKNITHESIKWSVKQLILNEKPQYVNDTIPSTIDNNFFFDYVHPNKWAHYQIGNELFNFLQT